MNWLSATAWPRDTPAGWETMPLKFLLDRNDGGVWGDDPAGEADTIVLRSTEQTVNGNWAITDPALRKLSSGEVRAARLARGDLLVTKSSGSSLHIGKTTLVDDKVAELGCCFSNFMQRLRTSKSLNPKYAWYLMNHRLMRDQFDLLSTSTTGLANLNGTIIGEAVLAVPPPGEQIQIIDFLDRETAKIDALVAKQEQLIATLREDRTATITHAVTKGLDPNVEMKDSGIEWLGEVPCHWTARRLATTYREMDERLCDQEAPELLSVSIYLGVRPRRELVTDKEARADDFTKYKLCAAGDIVLNRMRAFQGGLGVAYEAGIVSPDYMVMRVHPTECADFLGYVMKTPWFVERMTSRLRGIGGVDQGNARTPRINPGDLGRFMVALPPSREQHEIVNALGNQLADLDRLTAKTAQLIETMHEYRSALITDAVTGKIDVRGAA